MNLSFPLRCLRSAGLSGIEAVGDVMGDMGKSDILAVGSSKESVGFFDVKYRAQERRLRSYGTDMEHFREFLKPEEQKCKPKNKEEYSDGRDCKLR